VFRWRLAISVRFLVPTVQSAQCRWQRNAANIPYTRLWYLAFRCSSKGFRMYVVISDTLPVIFPYKFCLFSLPGQTPGEAYCLESVYDRLIQNPFSFIIDYHIQVNGDRTDSVGHDSNFQIRAYLAWSISFHFCILLKLSTWVIQKCLERCYDSLLPDPSLLSVQDRLPILFNAARTSILLLLLLLLIVIVVVIQQQQLLLLLLTANESSFGRSSPYTSRDKANSILE